MSIPECAATKLCAASAGDLHIDSSNCADPSCRFTIQENVGPTLTYEDGKIYVFLRFRDSIAGATTEKLLSVFEHVNFYVSYPVQGAEEDAIYFEQRTGIDAFGSVEVDLPADIPPP